MNADVVIAAGGVIGTATGRFPGCNAELEAATGRKTGLRTEGTLAVAYDNDDLAALRRAVTPADSGAALPHRGHAWRGLYALGGARGGPRGWTSH